MRVELDLTDLEAGFLTAAVVDFFHKMRASEDDALITWVEDGDYQAAKSLWAKVEAQTKTGEWKTPPPSKRKKSNAT